MSVDGSSSSSSSSSSCGSNSNNNSNNSNKSNNSSNGNSDDKQKATCDFAEEQKPVEAPAAEPATTSVGYANPACRSSDTCGFFNMSVGIQNSETRLRPDPPSDFYFREV